MVWLVALLACGWPRFDDAAGSDRWPASGPSTLVWANDEATDGDFPDWPSDLAPSSAALSRPYEGLLFAGELAWEPARNEGATDFGCDIVPLPLTYLGDVDFVRFAHGGGTTCITVATSLSPVPEGQRDPRFGCQDGPPLWDALIYTLEAEDGLEVEDGLCLTGTLHTPSPNAVPLALGEVDALLLPWLPEGDYAIGLAPICGEYAQSLPCTEQMSSTVTANCVPYALAVAIVPSQEACDLLHEQLQASFNDPS